MTRSSRTAALLALATTLPAQHAEAQQCEFPGVMVVLDRSASMRSEIAGQRKWDVAVSAIQSMLEAHGAEAHYGLMLYPGPSGAGAQGVEGPVGACRYNLQDDVCTPQQPRCTTGEVVVDLGPNSDDAILAELAWPAGLSHSYTPTWQSLEAVHRHAAMHDAARRNFVILITDGWQCCGLHNDDAACEGEDRNLPIEKVAQLQAAGIDTYVIGFGGSVDVQTLQGMAVAGGTMRAGCDPDAGGVDGDTHCYYQANDHAQLEGMLDGIGRDIADELCDGRDNDCDGRVDEDLLIQCVTACGPGESLCVNGAWTACDAHDPSPEVCDGQDNNCDGRADEGLTRNCATACGAGLETCADGAWGACDAPAPEEEVCDGEDNDCDGTADQGCECQAGEERACGSDVGECVAGSQTCDGEGVWPEVCAGARGPAAEVCDGLDNDCDGDVDGMGRACQTACGGGQERCEAGAWVGCDAPAPALEVCDGIDNDCDGSVDQGLSRPCTSDCGMGIETCVDGAWVDCTARTPGAIEVCDNGLDDNCDGQVEEGCECTDGDTQRCGPNLGECRQGEQTCAGGRWGACVGGDTPSPETCNGLDDDCNGVVDDESSEAGGRLCPEGQRCGCGACVGPCSFGECDAPAECVGGFCVADACPDGRVCEDGVCVEGGGSGGDGGDDDPLGGSSGGGVDVPASDGGLDGAEGDTGGPGGPPAADSCDCDVGAAAPRLPMMLRR